MANSLFIKEKYKAFGVKQDIYQGSGCISMLPKIMDNEDWTRAQLVVDPGVLKAGGSEKIEELLKNSGVEYCIFSKIEPNPLEEDIEKTGIPMYREFGAQVLIAIGGGSTMDSAKGIALVGDSDQTVKEAAGDIVETDPFKPLPWKTYPMIAIPTTCGTGSEVIRNAVITEPNGHKMVPMHDALIPAYALCDPDLLATLPPHVAAASAMDALVQAVECYVSLAANDFSETMSLRAIELIGPNIIPYYYNRAIPEYADAMSKGCMYAGIAWNTSFVAQIHGSNHPITELLHISHGDACAILFPAFVEYNGAACKEKLRKVYNLMYPDHPVSKAEFEIKMLVDRLIMLNRQLNILNGKTMADYGCTEELVDKMVSEFNPDLYTYPRTTTTQQLKDMYIRVMNGEYV